ncbi:MAG: hypothetical protein ACREPM_15335, partial [Gemmatimonadaceae bacterium]
VTGRLEHLFVIATIVTGALALADALKSHKTSNATAAAHALTRGTQARIFWAALAVGIALPVVLALTGVVAAIFAAALLALVGLWLHGHAVILAGQGPPIS